MLNLKKNALKYKDENGNMQDSSILFGQSEIDTTLTKSGVAADAKTVGDKLENYCSKNEIDNLELITIEDIDEIWGETIQLSSEVTF